jgi:hypothetical protein
MRRKRKRKSSCPKADPRIASKRPWKHARWNVFTGRRIEKMSETDS